MIDGVFIGVWIGGFLCGVGLTGKLMTKYYKKDWTKPHIQQFPDGIYKSHNERNHVWKNR